MCRIEDWGGVGTLGKGRRIIVLYHNITVCIKKICIKISKKNVRFIFIVICKIVIIKNMLHAPLVLIVSLLSHTHTHFLTLYRLRCASRVLIITLYS